MLKSLVLPSGRTVPNNHFEKANRNDLIEQTNQEIAVLQEYLPKQLSKEEIKENNQIKD